MEPLEFMERLAALVPHPRLHLIRFHGVLAPNAKLRSRMQAKAIRVDTQLSGGRADCARQALQAQHFLPSSRAERNPIGARESISPFSLSYVSDK